jgi:hypothetical protein
MRGNALMLDKLSLWKQVLLALVALLAVVGMYDALRNLPVVSGCAFYGDCPAKLPPEPPNAAKDAIQFAAPPRAGPA